MSAPRTDNLYAVGRQPDGSVGRPLPESETTKSYDLGWRLNHPKTIASVALYHIDYTNRIVSTFDSSLGFSVDRNVGDVKVDGVDMQIGQRFGELFALTASVSYNDSELQDDVPTAVGPLPTAGKTLVETPQWMFTARADMDVTPDLKVGLQGKKVDDRFGTDLNNEIAPGYTVFDLDVNYGFKFRGVERAEISSTSPTCSTRYYGNISSGTGTGTSVGFYAIGAPRTIMGSVRFTLTRTPRGRLVLLTLLAAGPVRAAAPPADATSPPAVRIATFNASLNRASRAGAARSFHAGHRAGARGRGPVRARASRHPAAARVRLRRSRRIARGLQG